MPDGSHAPCHAAPRTRDPALTQAMDRLLACAAQGLPPDEVLHGIRALLTRHGLLLDAGPPQPGGAGEDGRGREARSASAARAAPASTPAELAIQSPTAA